MTENQDIKTAIQRIAEDVRDINLKLTHFLEKYSEGHYGIFDNGADHLNLK